MDIHLLAVLGSWEVEVGNQTWTCMTGSRCQRNREAVEDNGCLCRDLENWTARDRRDPHVDLPGIAGMEHLEIWLGRPATGEDRMKLPS